MASFAEKLLHPFPTASNTIHRTFGGNPLTVKNQKRVAKTPVILNR